MFKNKLNCIIIVYGENMQDFIDYIVNNATFYLQNYGFLAGVLIIILESIIPALPLGVFIALNMMAFGNIIGFIISWISTIIGCLISYMFFSKIFGKKISKSKEKYNKLNKMVNAVRNIKFSNLVLMVALPFSPAFLINIACGFASVNIKKFLLSLIIGKVSIIYFWGFISKSLLQSITDLKTIIIILVLLGSSYLISKIVNKKLNIE